MQSRFHSSGAVITTKPPFLPISTISSRRFAHLFSSALVLWHLHPMFWPFCSEFSCVVVTVSSHSRHLNLGQQKRPEQSRFHSSGVVITTKPPFLPISTTSSRRFAHLFASALVQWQMQPMLWPLCRLVSIDVSTTSPHAVCLMGGFEIAFIPICIHSPGVSSASMSMLHSLYSPSAPMQDIKSCAALYPSIFFHDTRPENTGTRRVPPWPF